MKVITLGNPYVIIGDKLNKSTHPNFMWPTVCKLQNGDIAVVCSGYRKRHVCPYGTNVISISKDGGETFSNPLPVIDTPLDERDSGILTFGRAGVMITTFNNSVNSQRKYADEIDNACLDGISKETEENALGSLYRISYDGGKTFGKILKSPVTCPHGPLQLNNGNILWLGTLFDREKVTEGFNVESWLITLKDNGELNEEFEFLGRIKDVPVGDIKCYFCEPHAICLDDGTILAHIRVERGTPPIATIFQTVSKDGGKTWDTQRQILENNSGCPPHLIKGNDGTIICTYARRIDNFSIRAIVSKDNGKTWSRELEICPAGYDWDMGYPATVHLYDNVYLTVYYAEQKRGEPRRIIGQKWKLIL